MNTYAKLTSFVHDFEGLGTRSVFLTHWRIGLDILVPLVGLCIAVRAMVAVCVEC